MLDRNWPLFGHDVKGHSFAGDTAADVFASAAAWLMLFDKFVLSVDLTCLADEPGYALCLYYDDGATDTLV